MVEAVQMGCSACIAPFWARGPEPRVDLTLSPCGSSRVLPGGAKLLRATAAGLGLCAISRSALYAIAEANQGLVYDDAAGVRRLALFIEAIRPSDLAWMGEDLAFWSRVPPTVLIEAIVTGTTVHAGRMLDLEMVALAASQKTNQIQGLKTP
jgi:hypothetical protein